MEKKIRVTIPNEVFNIIMSDLEDFNITKNFLFNYIFENSRNLKNESHFKYNDKKNIIQFNLNKKNLENYYIFLQEKNIQVEAEFFRNIILIYANKSKKNRELFIFKNVVDRISTSIANNKKIIVTFKDSSKKNLSPFLISSSQLELKNYLFAYDEDDKIFKNFLIRNISSIFISNKQRIITDPLFINNTINNFDPFLSTGEEIKVSLSTDGMNLFNNLKTNRPKVLEKNNNILTLQCSLEQAKRYFSYFLDNVEILEPAELRLWFKNKLFNAFSLYKK